MVPKGRLHTLTFKPMPISQICTNQVTLSCATAFAWFPALLFIPDASQVDAEMAKVFDELDEDGSGEIEYKEMNAMLRKGAGGTISTQSTGKGPASAGKGKAIARPGSAKKK